jgi:tetratricopeptide (TPR) repeat protein
VTFVGRAQELTAIELAIADATAGKCSLVLVAGEPGIGKTRLADAACDHARSAGFHVAWGRCWETGGAPPLWPWAQLVREWSNEPAWAACSALHADALALLEPGADERAATQRWRLQRAITAILAALAVDQPLAFVIDDVHAADVGTLELLRGVLQELRGARVTAICTFRDVQADATPEVRALVAQLSRFGKRIDLGGLGEHDVGILVEETLHTRPTPELTSTLRAATGGNPFYLVEVLGTLAVDPTAQLAIPPGVRDAVRVQLARLDSVSVAVLDACAVLGRAAPIALLASIVAGDPAGGLHRAVRERILVEGNGPLGRTVGFAHALFRETIAADLPVNRRRELHRRVARALGEQTGDRELHAAEIARHLVAVVELGDPAAREAAVSWSQRAGAQAMRSTGWDDAVTHFAAAARFASGADEVRSTLLALGEAELAAGRRKDAAVTLRRVAELATREGDPVTLARAAIGIARTLEFVELDAAVIALLERAKAALVGDQHDELRARLLAQLASALWMDPTSRARRDELSQQAVAIARSRGEGALLAFALNARLHALQGPDGLDERISIATEIIQLATESGDLERVADGLRWRVGALFAKGDMVAADRDAAAAVRVADELRSPLLRINATMRLGMRAMLAGRWDEALALITRTHELSRAVLDPMADLVRACQLATIAVDRDDRTMLESTLDELAAGADRLGWGVFIRANLARALADLGRVADAKTQLARIVENDCARLPRDFVHLATVVQIGEVAIAVGDAAVIKRMRIELVPYGGQLVTGAAAFSLGSSWRYLGRLARADGDLDAARAALRAAIDHDGAMGALPSRAHDLVELAEITGDVALAQAARDTAQSLGMPRVLARASALLAGQPAATAPATRTLAELVRSSDSWTIRCGAAAATFRDRRGLGYLARLLGEPGRELHVLELAGAEAEQSGVAVLDPAAKAAYRARLEALREREEDATSRGDDDGAERARAEIETLAAELSRALGVGGRDRASGASADRARSAVTLAIRRAIEAIREHLPDLAAHLEHRVRTGVFCQYRPDPHAALDWRVTT